MNFSPPSIDPLSRLQVSQGLLITTERWQHAQTYHRQRQNLHYQSLHQPGIVRDFGVSVIPTPATARGKEFSYLWVRISPGIAIDLKGNPIISSTHRDFGIDPSKLDPIQGNSQTVYLVAQYVDPEKKHGIDFSDDSQVEASGALPEDQLPERCRIVQRSFAELQPEDVELCRVQLRRDSPQLQPAPSVYFPGENALDFRHRLIAQPRSQGIVRVTQAYTDTDTAAPIQAGLESLLKATADLCSTLQGDPHLTQISQSQLNAPPTIRQGTDRQKNDLVLQQLFETDFTYLPYPHLFSLSGTGRERLRRYLNQGGVILIEADPQTQPLEDIREELSVVLVDLDTDLETRGDGKPVDGGLRSQLIHRIDRVDARITENIDTICTQVKTFAHQIDHPLRGEGTLDHDHPLRVSPFTFSTWPQPSSESFQLFCWGGIVLALGNLSSLWAINPLRPRQDIRSAQEWGINLLHYAWKHHHLTQLQQGGIHHE